MLFLLSLLAIVYRSNPIFIQGRIGKRARLFTIFKVKTMHQHIVNGNTTLVITPIGKWLRRSSIDELPQLWNVLRGDMSLIGPRPLLPEHLFILLDKQHKRFRIHPGITGWAQVNGRNELSLSQKVEYDVWYVNHCSFFLDLRIIFKTFLVVCTGRGENSEVGPHRIDKLE